MQASPTTAAGGLGLILSCEHASWALPPEVDLGVPPDVLESQAGWDHGALDIATRLSTTLAVPVHAGSYTRMFVDLNRPATHPDAVPTTCYGAAVPGNSGLPPDERAARLAAHHAPYWDAIRRDARAHLDERGAVLHVALHSFDPALDPPRRGFELGVLYDPAHPFEAELASDLLSRLHTAGLAVRPNEPYHGTGPGVCTSLRGELAGQRYAGIQLEASHAITHRPGGCARIAEALAPALDALCS